MIGITSLNQCWEREGCISSLQQAARNVSAGIGRLPLTRSVPMRLAYKGGTVNYTRWGQRREGGRARGRAGLFQLTYSFKN